MCVLFDLERWENGGGRRLNDFKSQVKPLFSSQPQARCFEIRLSIRAMPFFFLTYLLIHDHLFCWLLKKKEKISSRFWNFSKIFQTWWNKPCKWTKWADCPSVLTKSSLLNIFQLLVRSYWYHHRFAFNEWHERERTVSCLFVSPSSLGLGVESGRDIRQ